MCLSHDFFLGKFGGFKLRFVWLPRPRNKPLEGDAMLTRVAEVTQGWSAAALANLMNEAAILTVRRGRSKLWVHWFWSSARAVVTVLRSPPKLQLPLSTITTPTPSPLQVRRGVEKITLPMVLEVIEAQEWGPGAPKIPPSEAKDRLALVGAL
jgi:cell division protease FtsH